MPRGPLVTRDGEPNIVGKNYLLGIEELSRSSVAVDGSEAMTGPLRLFSLSAADLLDDYDPEDWEGALVFVSGEGVAYSDGDDWLYVADDSAVT